MATQPLPNKSWEAVEGPVTCNAADMINIHITGTGTGATIAAGNCSPMIVLPGQFNTKALELAIQAGFDEFVSKPLDKEVLLALLKKARMEKHKTRKIQIDENNHALKQEYL